jgi:hypothetical protein
MQNLTVAIDANPDNDRFLPRYLTVQLLEILAQAFPTQATVKTEYSAAAQKFIQDHKSAALFNALTYSIFWREYSPEILEKNIDMLDDLDQFGRSALTVALANEDFELANQLIAAGAIVFLEDKIVLEIALISIMQRDPAAIDKVMQKAPEGSDWAKEYLDYLYGYAIGKPNSNPHKYREVLNPIIRHFGQVLDTMVYFNGTPSHYGFIGPSLNVLTKHLDIYAQNSKLNKEANIFKQIASAFEYSQRMSKFIGNMPDANAATNLCAAIQKNLQQKNMDPILVFGGWAGNTVALAFVNNYLILSNLGMGGDPQQGTVIYTIAEPKKISPELIHKFMFGISCAADPNDILGMLGEINLTSLIALNQFLTPIDNCIFVNPRAIIQGLLLILTAYQNDKNITTTSLNAVNANVANMYQAYVNALYQHSTEDLAAFMRNHLLLQNRRVECCSLAIEYINQHHSEPQSLKRCIELKNALEFVGLRDYYNNNILPEAKEAIQKAMISEQEAVALQVIAREKELQAKQS